LTGRLPEVFYPDYREFLRLRNSANDGFMALAVSAQLSSHFLQLTKGSERTLVEIFPAVTNVSHFNLKSAHALEELTRAEYLLALMAVPYHLGIFEDYVARTKNLLRRSKTPRAKKATKRQKNTDAITAWLSSEYGTVLPTETTGVLTVYKNLRHDLLHKGGKATADYSKTYLDEIEAAFEYWGIRPEGNVQALTNGQQIRLSFGDLKLILACVKRQAREINVALQTLIPHTAWAEVIVDDYLGTHQHKALNTEQHLRKCIGFTRKYYAALGIDPKLVQEQLKRQNVI